MDDDIDDLPEIKKLGRCRGVITEPARPLELHAELLFDDVEDQPSQRKGESES